MNFPNEGDGGNVLTKSHRLSTIRNADRIIVLGHGKILDEGNYETLRQAGGPFSLMVGS